MQAMKVNNIDETIYYEKLDSGLEVYMIPKPNKNNCYVTFTTKYGSACTEFISNNEKKYCKVPDGIAHFLEHQLFERGTGEDPFSFYASSGAEANAGTSFDYTSYLFSGADNLKNNLTYLLDFVSTPYFTDQTVEKEKGIIAQEIKLYDDYPLWVMQDGLRANIYAVDPIRKPVGGAINTINSITKEDLYKCYEAFYNPSNMILIIVGNFNPEEIIELVREREKNRNQKPIIEVKPKHYVEPPEVVKEHEEIEMTVEVPKLAFGIKIPLKKLGKFEPKRRNLYLGMIGYALFGTTSLFYEKMLEEEYLTSPIFISKIRTDDYIFAYLMVETKKPNELIEKIKEQLHNIKIDNKHFERIKKVLISSNITLYDDLEAINDKILSNILNYKKIYLDEIDIIKSLNMKELEEFIKVLDLSNTSNYVVKPKNT
jgi:predicted Zn-dependent peptidase